MLMSHTYTGGSQDRLEMRRRRMRQQMQGYQLAQFPEIVGGMMAADVSPNATRINWTAVASGVATGVSVYLITRVLDRVFGLTGGRK